MLIILIIGVSLLVDMAAARPYVDNQANSQILEIDSAHLPNSYKFYYDTNDGSSRSEHGVIEDPGTNKAALDVQGAVRWYDDKGNLYQMTYKAGKRGYRTIIKKLS